jgi:hypothetical protein
LSCEFYLVENLRDSEPKRSKITNFDIRKNVEIIILPRQEIEYWVMYIDTKDVESIVSGYEKALEANLTIEYKNMDNKLERYSYSYLITKMMSIPGASPYEVQLRHSEKLL